jgi:desulfoferrodoxin-like iron-binding protein
VAKVGEVFKCEICGNEAVITVAGGNPVLVCCGQPMTKTSAK